MSNQTHLQRFDQPCFDSTCMICVKTREKKFNETIPNDFYITVSKCLKEQNLIPLSDSLWKHVQEIDLVHKPFFLSYSKSIYEAVHQPPLQLLTLETFLRLYSEIKKKESVAPTEKDTTVESIVSHLQQQDTIHRDSFLVVVIIQKECEKSCFTQLVNLHRFAQKMRVQSYKDQNLPLPSIPKVRDLFITTP